MKVFYSLTLTVFLNFLVNAQKISLEWQGSTTTDYGVYKNSVPFFKNAGYNHIGNTITITVNQDAGTALSVKNMVWQQVSKADVYSLDPGLFPENERFSTDLIYDADTNKYKQRVTAETFKRSNGQIFRLSSFEIVPEESNAALGNRLAEPAPGTSENPLKEGTFYKIKVDKSGIFKITSKFLRDNGINPGSINPKNFRIYGNGGLMLPEDNRLEVVKNFQRNVNINYPALQENAIQVVGEEDGRWDENDYALFYAQGPNGFNVYGPNGNRRKETRSEPSGNFTNIYDDYAYYFITFDKGAGKRIAAQDSPLPAQLITRYDAYQYINEDKINLLRIGRLWLGDQISATKTITFSTSSPINAGDKPIFRARVAAYQASGNKMNFSVNGAASSQTASASNYSLLSFSGQLENASGNQFNFTFSPDISTNPNGKFFLDYAEIQYKENLEFNGGQLPFRYYAAAEGKGTLYGFSIARAQDIEQVWDVSDITNAKRKVNKAAGSTFDFGYSADSKFFNNEFIAFKNSAAFAPTFVGKVENQDLSSKVLNYVIITTPQLIPQAERLAKYHRDTENFSAEVVDINKIYNEFSSGGKDITAIRNFTSRLKKNGDLKYVFILGDTSYDFKGKIDKNSDIIPAFQSEDSSDYASSFVTDDYYGMTGEQANLVNYTIPDIPVGRLPAANGAEAKLLIDKTLAYYNALPNQSTPFGDWKMNLDIVVDDDLPSYNPPSGTPFHTTVENAIKEVFENTADKPEYHIRKLYLDAFPAVNTAAGQQYPAVNQKISTDLNNSLMVMYFGHGGVNGWAQERVLTADDIRNFNNYNSLYSRFPLVSTITCEFALWDDPQTFSAGEQVMKHSSGGAAAMLTSSRALPIIYGEEFVPILLKQLFQLENGDFKTLGDAFLAAKKLYAGNQTNHFRTNLLGDPAMKLTRPKNRIVLDALPQQLRGLDFVKIGGKITKTDGTTDTSFNGKATVVVYDKKTTKNTLNNDKDLLPVLTYQEEGSPIVKASTTVTNGVFLAEFYVPKDINFDAGQGRILAYADNRQYDAVANQKITVGGVNPDGINDSKAPGINLYMNNTNFADGGVTNQNPTLLACLTDESGINSTGSGIGHDITVVLDGEVINTKVLNDFYSAGEGNGCISTNLKDYQKGSVMYPLRNLSPGQHQLVFKVWDINNNSSTATLNFVVKQDGDEKLTINRLLNWPNPFTNKTYIQFEHNCTGVLEVNTQIYTITGRLVRNLTNTVGTESHLQGFRIPKNAIEWDGTDDYGDTVAKGTYIYKVTARGAESGKCSGTATAVEKMVLLK